MVYQKTTLVNMTLITKLGREGIMNVSGELIKKISENSLFLISVVKKLVKSSIKLN